MDLRITALIDVNGLNDLIVSRMRKFHKEYSYEEIADMYKAEFVDMLDDIIANEEGEDEYERLQKGE